MKNSERTTRSLKAIAVIVIIGLTIVYNSNFHLNTFKSELTQNLQTDTTQQIVQNELDSRIELLSFTTKLLATGIKQFISNH